MIMPGTLSTITAAFPPEKRSKGVATWSGFAAAGAIIGLLVAGGLLEQWGWQSIFRTSAAVAVLAGAAATKLSRNTRESHRERFDIRGAVSTSIAIGALVFAIIEGSETGWTKPEVVVAIVLSVGGFVAYTIAGLRTPHSLLDPRLFKLRGFRAGSITIVVQFMAVFGFFFVGLQFVQLILGYSPFKGALAMLPVAAVVLPMSQQTPKLVARFGLRTVMAVGLLSLAAGMFWLISHRRVDHPCHRRYRSRDSRPEGVGDGC